MGKLVVIVLLSFFMLGVSLLWHPSFFTNGQAFQVFVFILVLDILWISQAIPMGITSLLPLLFFPSIDLFSLNDVIANYISKISFVIIASSAIGLAFAKYNLHKATICYVLSKLNTSPNGFIYSVTLASCFISMFISNTVTGVIMLPLVYAMVKGAYFELPCYNSIKNRSILAVCFASSIGGLGTVFGSPVNFLGIALLEKHFNKNIDFLTWSLFTLPVVFILTLFLLLILRLKPALVKQSNGTANLNRIYSNLKYNITNREKLVIATIVISLTLALFSSYITKFIGVKVDYFYVLITATIFLFSFPLQKPLLSWKEDAIHFPWQVILVMGASFSFAGAIAQSGLQSMIVTSLSVFASEFSLLLVILVIIILLLLFTEISSASGALVLFFPIVALLPNLQGVIKAEYLTILMVMASSLAFMLPISTIPNLLATSSYIKPKYLLKKGFVLNLVAVFVLCILTLIISKVL